MKRGFLLGAGVALAAALSWAPAQAQLFVSPAGPGAWYFGGEGGWTHLDDAKIHGLGGGSEKFDDGFNIGARGGYEWGPLRFEEEFSFRQNGITSVSGFPTHGNRNAYAIMTNAIYDFNLGWPFSPHIGVGIGAVGLHDAFGVPGVGTIAHDTQWEFGYQAIAGVRYNINPSLAFDIDYRYLATTDPTFHHDAFTIPTTAGPVAVPAGTYRSEYSSHSLVASLTVKFGAAPPPAVAPPPAPPAPPLVARKVFLVFFDWDRDTITPEGMQIIRQAAAAFHSGAPVTIQVTGYTDRSGSAGYNQRLSERRANNVARAMVGLGVPRQAMVVSGRGENDNRVPTADGVREPQNRRVEIVFP